MTCRDMRGAAQWFSGASSTYLPEMCSEGGMIFFKGGLIS